MTPNNQLSKSQRKPLFYEASKVNLVSYHELSSSELLQHVNWLEKSNKLVWEFLQKEKTSRKEYSHARSITGQQNQMIEKCKRLLSLRSNAQTVGGKSVNEFNAVV